ncbi:MAG: ABC transporter permease [Vicinamibacterales bacterium]
MLRGLGKLTWLELKIFIREPLGVVGSVVIPVVLFTVLGRMMSRGAPAGPPSGDAGAGMDVPIFGALLISLNAVLSLVTIIAIYREGGILKRLRATPLRPHVILTAHVIVKLIMTAVTLAAAYVVGVRYSLIPGDVRVAAFGLALVFVTVTILSMGFLIASLVPTARFAQPVGSLVLYPMIAVSGLFVPVASLPPVLRLLARVVPLSYAVSLLKGIWQGHPWSAHLTDVLALIVIFLVCTTLSSRLFRWS